MAFAVAGTIVLLALVTACGSDHETTTTSAASIAGTAAQPPSGPPSSSRVDSCKPVGRVQAGAILFCWTPNVMDHGSFMVERDQKRRRIPIATPGPTPSVRDLVGHWAWAALSPNRKTILAHWSAECEVPFAFLIPASGGKPRVVTGESDWATSPESFALGWTEDGRAIVFIPRQPGCGSGVPEPGIYLFRSPGEGELVRSADRRMPPLPRSLQPRRADAL
jgi:hypothetical protein